MDLALCNRQPVTKLCSYDTNLNTPTTPQIKSNSGVFYAVHVDTGRQIHK